MYAWVMLDLPTTNIFLNPNTQPLFGNSKLDNDELSNGVMTMLSGHTCWTMNLNNKKTNK